MVIPLPNPAIDHHIPRASHLNRVPISKPLTTCYGEGINKPSDTDTPDLDEQSPPRQRPHRRHSLLSPFPESPTTESFPIAPELTSTLASAGSAAAAERVTLAEFYGRSQQQEDSDETRMRLQQSERQFAEEKKAAVQR